MKKSLKKAQDYTYTVDLSEINKIEDIDAAFAIAKFNANLPLSKDDLKAIVDYVDDTATTNICICNICECKIKLPWYKRFWRWITGKNRCKASN